MKQLNANKHFAWTLVVCLLCSASFLLGQTPTIDGKISSGEPYTLYKTYNTSTCKGSLYKYETSTDIYFAWCTSRGLNNNVYNTDANKVKYDSWKYSTGHTLVNLRNSDHLSFCLKKTNGTKVVDVDLDYLFKDGTTYKSGLGSGNYYNGVNRVGGNNITGCKSSLEYNIYHANWSDWQNTTPCPESGHPEWEYKCVYEFKVDKSCLNGSGYDGDADESYCTPKKQYGVPELTITDDAVLGCVSRNANLTYTITVKNIGPVDLLNTKIDLDYDQYTTYVSSSITPSSGNNEFSLNTIVPDQSKSFTVTVHVSNSAPNQYLTLKGEVEGDGENSNDIDIEKSFTTTVCNPLPVELVSFTSAIVNKNVELKWKTATEVNNYGFEVHRQTSAGNWETIGFIEGHGTVNTPQNYSFTDEKIGNKGTSFKYRLKQIDRDGTFDYSPIIEANFKPARRDFGLVSAYPNPFNPSSMIQFYIPSKMPVSLKIYNMLGQVVSVLMNGEIKTEGTYSMMFDAKEFPSGIYYAWLTSGDALKSTYKLTLEK